jgi:hypothetical protein
LNSTAPDEMAQESGTWFFKMIIYECRTIGLADARAAGWTPSISFGQMAIVAGY